VFDTKIHGFTYRKMEILLILIYLLVWTRIFVLSVTFRPAFRQAQCLSQRLPEDFLGVKFPGSDTDHNPSSTALTNAWKYTVFPGSLHYLEFVDNVLSVRLMRNKFWTCKRNRSSSVMCKPY